MICHPAESVGNYQPWGQMIPSDYHHHHTAHSIPLRYCRLPGTHTRGWVGDCVHDRPKNDRRLPVQGGACTRSDVPHAIDADVRRQCSASIRSRCHNIYAIIRSHKTSVGGSVDCCLCRFRHHEKLAHPHPGSGSGISSETIGLRGLCAIICYWHHLEEEDLQLTVMPPQRMLKSCNSRLSALSCKFVWQTMCLLHVGILSV